MYHKEIFATIMLAHYFESAFSRDQVYRYLRVRMERERFDEAVEALKCRDIIFERGGNLFTRDLEASLRERRRWSRDLFLRHKRYLTLISRIPWVKYLALTGANAFESCREQDDIDLFLITQKDRLWICYLALVLFSKALRKRGVLCINYLVDEDNLHIRQQDYYTAVQIMQMAPLLENDFSRRLIESNHWIFRFLPNARAGVEAERFYSLSNGRHRNGKIRGLRWISALNNLVYRGYTRRLAKKYPREFGRGIVLDRGLAKLNRIDHQDIYETIYREIEREIETAYPGLL